MSRLPMRRPSLLCFGGASLTCFIGDLRDYDFLLTDSISDSYVDERLPGLLPAIDGLKQNCDTCRVGSFNSAILPGLLPAIDGLKRAPTQAGGTSGQSGSSRPTSSDRWIETAGVAFCRRLPARELPGLLPAIDGLKRRLERRQVVLRGDTLPGLLPAIDGLKLYGSKRSVI